MPSGELNAAKKECPQGHPYNKENTYTENKRSGHKSRKCRSCHNEVERIAYAKNSEVKKADQRNRKAEMRRRVDAVKTHCTTCDESATECLDFHHEDPKTKTQSVSWMISNGRSWETISAEIDKCTILCANCHRKLEAAKRRERINGIGNGCK